MRHQYYTSLLLLLTFLITSSCFLFAEESWSAQTGKSNEVRITKAPDGGWVVTGNGYTASVNAAGYLSSFRVDAVETMGGAFSYHLSYQPGAVLAADDMVVVGDTLKVHLKGASGEATIDYQFRRNGFVVTPVWKAGGYAEFRFTASPALLGTELLNDKSVTGGGDATHFREQGEIRGIPAVPSSRNQMVRFHYPNFGLHAYVQAWGAPYNYESAGSIHGHSWGRPLLEANRPFPIVFTVQRKANSASLSAPVFVPRTQKVASLYYRGEPCVWNLDLGERKSYQYLLDAGIRRLSLAWSVTDIHDQEVARGKGAIALDATGEQRTVLPVILRTPGTGYYQVLFTLADPSGKALTSSFRTRFTVIHQAGGSVNRDDRLAGTNDSPYAIMGMIGLGGIRESHEMSHFFTNQEPKEAGWVRVDGAEPAVWMNIQRLDAIMNSAAAQSKKNRLTWFFQANGRPGWATAPLYEAMVHALVARYKDRCSVWEVENEPNFHYSPEDYVNLCLIPFAKGAKRADPDCVVMGPGCVGVKDTLRFMDAIYRMKANRWLDAISTHTYPGPGESWEQFGNVSMLRQLRQWMQANGDGHKALWQTEQGYRWDYSPRIRDARYAARQFLQGWRLGIEPSRQYYFYPNWHGFESFYLAGQGEAGSEASWTPLAAALRFLAENTQGRKYVGDITAPYQGIYLARFSGDEGDVVAAWTWDFPYALRAQVPGLKKVVDFMGNPAKQERKNTGMITLPLSGEPIYIHLAKGSSFTVRDRPFGANIALAAAGARASASSEEKGGPAAHANDGIGELWEDVIGLRGRTAWKSARKDPTSKTPDWLQVTFPQPRTINRIVARCYLPAVSPSPRDWAFQVLVKDKWSTVAQGKGDQSWVLHRTFAPVTTTKIRMMITKINDGWHLDQRWMPVLLGSQAVQYTESKMLVSELEAYGPPSAQNK